MNRYFIVYGTGIFTTEQDDFPQQFSFHTAIETKDGNFFTTKDVKEDIQKDMEYTVRGVTLLGFDELNQKDYEFFSKQK